MRKAPPTSARRLGSLATMGAGKVSTRASSKSRLVSPGRGGCRAGGQVGGEGWPARGGHRGDPPTAPVRRVSHTGSVRMYVDVLAAATLSLARLVSAEMAIGTASSLLSSNEAST